MKVCKFHKIKEESDIESIVSNIQQEQPYVVIVPTMPQLQQWLQKISVSWFQNNPDASHTLINTLSEHYCAWVDRMIKNEQRKEELKIIIRNHTDKMHRLADDFIDLLIDKIIKAEGYRLSANLILYALLEKGIRAKLLDTEEFVKLTIKRNPDIPETQESIKNYIAKNQEVDLFVAPLSLCRNIYDETDFVSEKRNDYYAISLAAIFKADEVVLWTDAHSIYTASNRIKKQYSLTYGKIKNPINKDAHPIYADCLSLASSYQLAVRIIDTYDTGREILSDII